MLAVISIEPTEASPTPGTCLPLDKGGTGCDMAEAIDHFGIYPVGSIYITTTSANPGTYLGGTWEAFGDGRTLVGVGSNGTTNYTSAQATGGVDSVALNVNQMPNHQHDVALNGDPNFTKWSSTTRQTAASGSSFWTTWEAFGDPSAGPSPSILSWKVKAVAVGGNQAHENRMPYITVYFWKRVS